MAVADADCTQATDLADIYFAVQGTYEHQVVSANRQAINTAVREYKANYAKELSKLPALLRTTSAAPVLPHGPGRPGGHAHAGRPAPPTPNGTRRQAYPAPDHHRQRSSPHPLRRGTSRKVPATQ